MSQHGTLPVDKKKIKIDIGTSTINDMKLAHVYNNIAGKS
jgi:hypothetical protein